MPKPPRKEKNPLRQAAILSGIAVEMGVIIYLAAQAGIWLDAHYQTEKKLFTALCTILGVGISLWVVVNQLKRLNP
ncbi:MAG: AtpZ/AtpI family protein [Robiginitalea sp.]|nr:AtpZ/AtpI family protein [Robiginitalea sp.]